MKQNRTRFFVFALVFAVNAVAGVAQARTPALLRMLEMPIARIVLTETEEGAQLTQRLLGRSLSVGATDVEFTQVFAALSRAENAEGMTAFTARLAQIQSEMQVVALASGGEADLRSVLALLAPARLRLAPGEIVRFTPIKTLPMVDKLKAQVKAAMEAEAAAKAAAPAPEGGAAPAAPEAPRALIGRDFTAARLGPQSGFVGSQVSFSRLRDLEVAETDFSGYIFDYSDFQGSRIFSANFRGASFRGADLTATRFKDTTLAGADLSGARLNRAILKDCDLAGADLRGADLSDAVLGETFFKQGQFDVSLEGALFDAHTRLPFSRAQAEKLGMVFVAE